MKTYDNDNSKVSKEQLDDEINRRYNARKKSAWVFALIAFLLGGFGAHRAYLGQWYLVPVYVLFACAIPSSTVIVAIMEMILSKWIVEWTNNKIMNRIKEDLFPLTIK